MSGKGTAFGAPVGVAEGDGVWEGDVLCACATGVKHSNSRLTTVDPARSTSVIILSAEARESLMDWDRRKQSNVSFRVSSIKNNKDCGDRPIDKSLGIQLVIRQTRLPSNTDCLLAAGQLAFR